MNELPAQTASVSCMTYCPAAPRAVEEGCRSIRGSTLPGLTAGSLGSTGGT